MKPKISPKVVLQNYCPVQALIIINEAVAHYTRLKLKVYLITYIQSHQRTILLCVKHEFHAPPIKKHKMQPIYKVKLLNIAYTAEEIYQKILIVGT